MTDPINDKLVRWKNRLAESDQEYKTRFETLMDQRERLYLGDRTMRPLVPGDHKPDGRLKKTSHVRNIVFELVESQVSSSIPMPKVTPRRKADERLADIIEHWLRNELDRLPMEAVNDLAERTVPIQGGCFFLVDWDDSARTPFSAGEVQITLLHPKQIAPQPGVYTSIEDMDWIIVKLPTTKEAVRQRYGVDVEAEGESEPEVRAPAETADEHQVTLYVGYEKNERGSVDRYVWVNDTELEDLPDYQARREPVCRRCGAPWPEDGDVCPRCGGTEWTTRVRDRERIIAPVDTELGFHIDGAVPVRNELGLPVIGEDGMPVMEAEEIPFYRPDRFPIVLQRSVSTYGQLLGSSDVDVIRDQQNTYNRLSQKIIDRLMKAGTRITLPDRADLRTDPEDGERWFLKNAAEKDMISVYQFSGNLNYEMSELANVYEEARQGLGITDSFQGRKDTTATSGTAKQFAAAQSAGRLESKRVMKNAAYANLFELMFKLALAYSDEPRTVSHQDNQGRTVYETFNRYDFLVKDEAGNWRWNDQFLFSVDTSEPLASNREAMWQETRLNLTSGAFGDPSQLETLILFWAKMEALHYPEAGATKGYLEDRLQQQQQAAMMQQMQAMQGPSQPAFSGQLPQRGSQEALASPAGGGGPGGAGEGVNVPPELAQAIERRARADAAAAINQGR